MKSETLKQFLAEKRKSDVQRDVAVMDTLDKLTHVNDNSYCGSAVIINITDLEGEVVAVGRVRLQVDVQVVELPLHMDVRPVAAGVRSEGAIGAHLVEAYRQTLAEKSTFAEYNLRKMQCMIKGLDPERSK